MPNISRKTLAVITSVCAVLVIGVVSVYITLAFTRENGGAEAVSHIMTEDDYARAERYSRLDEVYERLMSDYYVMPDPDQLVQGAIDGMLGSLKDPYTFYYTPEEMATATDDHNGMYSGVGMLVTSDKEGRLLVLRVFRNSPAQHSGVLPGDVIIAADGLSVSAETSEIMNEAVSRIKGASDTQVTLTILRKDKTLDITVNRSSVTVNRVEYQMLEGDIGYLVLYEFFGDAYEGVQEALRAFEDLGAKGIIFDVRSNPGGDLKICTKICDMMLPEGLILYIEDREGRRDNYYSDEECYRMPMVVLVNDMSASASEIFAASVQDYGMGVIVGENTYGKGVVQTVYPFDSDGAGMQLTTSSYYTPKGRSIHDTGVTPDVIVEMREGYDAGIYAPDMQNDNQLKTAYDTLLGMLTE